MAKIRTAVVLFLSLLYSLSYCQKSTTSVSTSPSVSDSVYLNEVVRLLDTHYVKGELDSIFYYLNILQYYGRKSNRANAELFYFLGHYHRDYTTNNTKALKMLNKASFYAKKANNIELIERINYLKLIIYSELFSDKNNLKNQKKFIEQFFENVSFSLKNNSKRNLISSYYIIKDVYKNYKQDSTFYAYFEKDIYYFFSSPISIYNHALYFEYFTYKKDFNKASKHLDTLLCLHTKQEINESTYSYFLNEMLSMSLKNLPLATKVSQHLKPKIIYLTNNIHKLTYYNNFTKLHLNKNQYTKARHYQKLAKSAISKINRVPLSIKLDYLTNEQILLKKEGKEYESLKLYEQIIPIKARIDQLFSVFNIAILQEQANNNYKLQKNQYEIDLKRQEAKLLSEKNRKESIYLILTIFILIIIIKVISFQVIKINKQKKELQLLSDNQNTIFTVIGHDLRSPVISIYTALLSALNKAIISDEATRTSLRKKTALLNSFILTLDNLLNWANSQQSSFKIKPTQVDINDILEEVIELQATNIEYAEVLILNHIPPDSYCFVDENHLKIILRNLIQNAIKFTPQNGTIQIVATHNDTSIEIAIQDSGLGFNATSNSPSKGSGLGLLLVQKLVTMNNGTFMKSDTEKGALVTLSLPIP